MWQITNLVPHYRTVFKRLICSHLLPFHQRVLQASSAGRQLVLKFWSRGPPLFSSCRLCFCWTSGTNRTQTETQQAVETDTNLQTVYFLLVVTVVFSFSGDSRPDQRGATPKTVVLLCHLFYISIRIVPGLLPSVCTLILLTFSSFTNCNMEVVVAETLKVHLNQTGSSVSRFWSHLALSLLWSKNTSYTLRQVLLWNKAHMQSNVVYN